MRVCHAVTLTIPSPAEDCLRRSHFTIYTNTTADANVCARVLHEYVRRQIQDERVYDDEYLPED